MSLFVLSCDMHDTGLYKWFLGYIVDCLRMFKKSCVTSIDMRAQGIYSDNVTSNGYQYTEI